MSDSNSSAGGSAAAGGVGYEARVAAWYAVRMVAEDQTPPLNLGNCRFTEIRCQSGEPVDDLLVGTSEGGWIYIQAKRSIDLSPRSNSVFAGVVDQAVRQLHVCDVPSANPLSGWNRPFEDDLDRIVLICGPNSSSLIRVNLRNALNRFREIGDESQILFVARNNSERDALNKTIAHVKNSWTRLHGSEASSADVSRVLRAIWIDVKAVEVDESDEQTALHIIQSAVVADPSDARSAWTILCEACHGFAIDRSGANQLSLRQILERHGIRLRDSRTYAEDISKLRRSTVNTLAYLKGFSQITTGTTADPIRVVRTCIEPLAIAAKVGGLLVTGAPGSGKSGALHDLAITLQNESIDVVALSIDQLPGFSESGINDYLGISRSFVDALANWTGNEPGYLIIDAFDAARKAQGPQNLCALIADIFHTAPRWHLVISVRTFDLRYNQDLQDHFRGPVADQAYADSEFEDVRHYCIPRFTDEEREQIREQAPELYAAAQAVAQNMGDETWLPFHLKLLGWVLGQPGLDSIQTQLELLNLYWRKRIASGASAVGYVSLLRRIANEIVNSRRLEWTASSVTEDESRWIQELTSAGVLIERQPGHPDTLVFGHHILTDYAVAQLTFRQLDESIQALLQSESDLLVAFRPSLIFAFQSLWDENDNHEVFWRRCREFQQSSIRAIGKLLGPTVASHRFRTISDVDLLLRELPPANGSASNPNSDIIRHVIGAAVASQKDVGPLVGATASEWCLVAVKLSERLSEPIIHSLYFLLFSLCESISELTHEQLASLGIASRALLNAVIESPHPAILQPAIRFVCKTFSSNPSASEHALRHFLQPEDMARRGYLTLYPIANEIKSIITNSPHFVEEIYMAAFGYRERRKGSTQLGDSQILSFTSNIQQDYELCLYSLKEAFPILLRDNPRVGTRVIVHVMAVDEKTERHYSAQDAKLESFSIAGHQAQIRPDGSIVWLSTAYPSHGDSSEMLASWASYVSSISERDNGEFLLSQIIEVLALENELALFWNRLLRCITSSPVWFGDRLKCLLSECAILRNPDTTTEAGNAIRAIYSLLDDEERSEIEETLLSLVHSTDEAIREDEERLVGRLIGCIPEELIYTADAREILQSWHTRGGPPDNGPPFEMEFGWSEIDEAERYGVTSAVAEAAPNKCIRELTQPINEFRNTFMNEAPTGNDVASIWENLSTLHAALATANSDGVDPKIYEACWGAMTEACADIANCETLNDHPVVAEFVRDQLLLASRDDCPRKSNVISNSKDDTPFWSTPAPRVYAAQGLPCLARWPECSNPQVLAAIEHLSSDSIPAVRLQVARRCALLYQANKDLMWQILNQATGNENNRFILKALVSGPLRSLLRCDYDCTIPLVSRIYNRSIQMQHADQLRATCTVVFLSHYLYEDRPECIQFIERILSDIHHYQDEIGKLTYAMKELLRVGPVKNLDEIHTRARDRAHELFARVAGELSLQVTGWNLKSIAEQEKLAPLLKIADRMAAHIHFASKWKQPNDDTQGPTIEHYRVFLDQIEPALTALSVIGHPSVAYHLVEALEASITAEPDRVIMLIRDIVKAAQVHGLTYESLAADHVVKIVARYLTEYRGILRENSDSRDALLDLLDAFVEAGWRSAMALTYRVHEMYR